MSTGNVTYWAVWLGTAKNQRRWIRELLLWQAGANCLTKTFQNILDHCGYWCDSLGYLLPTYFGQDSWLELQTDRCHLWPGDLFLGVHVNSKSAAQWAMGILERKVEDLWYLSVKDLTSLSSIVLFFKNILENVIMCGNFWNMVP